MASDHQMTVARTARSLPPAQISKTTRQVVPAFLQKLYEMVNDPKNHDLIRWSDAGDSFFVLDHERFAHDVLGRWFKHRNFSSFVRQLNMYGFHKIPHLQQGVLKSDTETEFWNFAHANFHRGQPDMLCLIQRKKTNNQSTMDDPMDVRESQNASATASTAPSSTANVQGQLVDVQAIVSGIAAIKRHQTTISAELQELKRSNQLLWQDSMAARNKYQKQQDTINRIVKFLAGVFGTTAHPKEDSAPNSTMVVPRRPARFMIEDARRDGKGIVEMEDLDTLPTIETPKSEPSPAASEYIATPEQSTTISPDTPTAPTPTIKRHEPQPVQPAKVVSSDIDVRAVTPSRLNTAPVYDFDHRLQGVLNQLTPAQIQQLVAQLSSQPLPDPIPTASVNPPPLSSTPTSSSTSTSTTNASHLTQYTPPPFDFSFSNPPTNSVFAPSLGLPTPSEGLISFNPYDPTTQPETVERHWQAAEDIEEDVNALNTSIHQLIQTFGLDPNLVEVEHPGTNEPGSGGLPGSTANTNLPNFSDLNSGVPSTSTGGLDFMPSGSGDAPMDINPSDFDFDAFFNTLPTSTAADAMDYTDSASTAFLDEVPSPASTASPIQPLRHLSPETAVGGGGTGQTQATLGSAGLSGNNLKKRKSDVSDLEGMVGLPHLQATHPSTNVLSDATLSPTTGKAKRRKEK